MVRISYSFSVLKEKTYIKFKNMNTFKHIFCDCKFFLYFFAQLCYNNFQLIYKEYYMAINYRRLWKLLIDMDLRKTDLREKAKLSSATIAKISQNKVVQSDVLDRICLALNCNIEDIMEIEHDTIERDNCKCQGTKNEPIKYSIVSLFSGCGGLDLGFKGGFDFLGKHYDKHPFEIIWANEINTAACRT